MKIVLADHEVGTAFQGDYKHVLDDLQERLSRQMVALHVHKRKAIIVCEGWDASGKGGAIERLTAKADPRIFRVWPITAPSEEEKSRHYLWRFWARLPSAGQVAIFDRSWYGRVLVERVEGFASEAEWRRAYDEINEFESQLASDGTIIVKLFFHITQEVQDSRFRARLDHPWKRWKVTAEDLRNRGRRGEYLEATQAMFDHNHTRWAPWTVIDGNDKKSARIAALSAIADAFAAALPSGPPPISAELEQLPRELSEQRD